VNTEQFAEWWRQTGHHELKQILFWRWDPIGVADDFPETADEYDSYAPQLVELLHADATEAEIAAHLAEIEHETIGLSRRRPNALAELASFLKGWFEASVASWEKSGPLRR
jgi:hypothetical protein